MDTLEMIFTNDDPLWFKQFGYHYDVRGIYNTSIAWAIDSNRIGRVYLYYFALVGFVGSTLEEW
jgi:hypothetical protein